MLRFTARLEGEGYETETFGESQQGVYCAQVRELLGCGPVAIIRTTLRWH